MAKVEAVKMEEALAAERAEAMAAVAMEAAKVGLVVGRGELEAMAAARAARMAAARSPARTKLHRGRPASLPPGRAPPASRFREPVPLAAGRRADQ